MERALRGLIEDYFVLKAGEPLPSECSLRDMDYGSAYRFLQSLSQDSPNWMLLRHIVAEVRPGTDLGLLSDDELLHQLSQWVASGELKIGATPQIRVVASSDRSEATTDDKKGEAPRQYQVVKLLKGMMIEVTWGSGIKVSYSKATVPAPHWRQGLAVADGAGSNRPGVYVLKGKGSDALTVKLRITENKNVSGSATLKGNLGGLQMEGTSPTAVGEHTVGVKITNLPDSIQRYRGDATWRLDVPDLGSSISLDNPTRLELYVVLDTPASVYDPPGVWTEVLRFLCDKVGVIGMKMPKDVAAQISKHCHSSHGLKYDTFSGAPAYGCGGGGGVFQLNSYIVAAKTVVNCYDQAGAIQSLCGAVGVKLTWYYLDPYGFIKTTNLVGIGACNNPFFSSNGSSAVMPVDDPKRTAFGNHAFGGLAGKVLDACAGPHTGGEDKAQYCAAAIDSATTLYGLYGGGFRAGMAGDIAEPGGVSKVV
ncbi:MAG TPA: hypothetical protein VE398_03475 [Acidobacteriota bacterium]|nr:hypothetical protein [Acidobacteriota bacterium]